MNTAVVFDLDGTLVDSIGDLSQAVNRMLADIDQDPMSDQTVQRFVGNGLPTLVKKVMLHRELAMDRHETLTQMTLDHYNAATCDKTTVYPGVIGALDHLRDMGCALGVCTNKPEAPANHVLTTLGLAPYFDVVFGGDTLSIRKPDPDHLHASFDALGVDGPRIYVGDSEVDAETAHRANVPFLLFTQGYRKSPVSELIHAVSFDDFQMLPECVERVKGKTHGGAIADT